MSLLSGRSIPCVPPSALCACEGCCCVACRRSSRQPRHRCWPESMSLQLGLRNRTAAAFTGHRLRQLVPQAVQPGLQLQSPGRLRLRPGLGSGNHIPQCPGLLPEVQPQPLYARRLLDCGCRLGFRSHRLLPQTKGDLFGELPVRSRTSGSFRLERTVARGLLPGQLHAPPPAGLLAIQPAGQFGMRRLVCRLAIHPVLEYSF